MGAFENRAGRMGYDETGSAISGMAGSQARDEERKRVEGQKRANRQAEKNAKDALKAGDMKGWLEWSAAAGGVPVGAPDAEQAKKKAEAMVYRNVNDAANLRPVGTPPDPNQPVGQQPPVAGANAASTAPATSNTPNAPQSPTVDGSAPSTGSPPPAGTNAPNTTVQAPSGTTEQSVRDEISSISNSNPYGLPSVDQENAKRAELEKQGAFGTKTKEFERFQDSKNRRSDADALREQYASGAMGKDEFMERGMAIKGATKSSLENIINANEKVDSVEPSTKVADDKIASNNKRILDEARARGALDSRDPNYNPNDPKYTEATIKRGATDTLDQTAFDQNQKAFNDKMLGSELTKQNIDIFKQQISSPNSSPQEKAVATASLNKINDEILAKGTGVEAEQAKERLQNFKYVDNAIFDVNAKEAQYNKDTNVRNARNAEAKRSVETAARNERAKAERKAIIDLQNQSMSYWMQF